ncbi:MAG TPA: hypothetical protein VNY74_12200 [Edaphobacter sp.]|nr:hypothetical protein [Edaphobacter sp.]
MSLYTFVSLGLLWVTAGAAGQQHASNKQPKEVQMFTLQQDGSLTEISRETAAEDSERVGMSVANPQNIVVLARLPGGKAKIRYTEGQDVRTIAILGSVDPSQIELISFENRGQIRVAYLAPFRSKYKGHWNTHPFRARQLKDGRWLLEPSSQLDPGEYCFSPKFDEDNFCFGIDKK